MKVFLRDIPAGEEGTTVDFVLTAKELDLPEEGFSSLSPLAVNAHLTKDVGEVSVEASVTGQFLFVCARCLTEVKQSRTVDFACTLEITPDSEFVDLSNDVREEMIIAVSPIVFCQDDCKGLCPSCGKNWNNESCSCVERK